ncbi:hypothetical protein EOM09_07865, partial [bacterium]|nr:hypothetical protein [bacterium]
MNVNMACYYIIKSPNGGEDIKIPANFGLISPTKRINGILDELKALIDAEDSEKEKKAYLKLLEHDILEKNGILLPAIEPINWLAEKASDLIEDGFEIYGEDKLINIRINRFEPKIKLNLSSNIDWFDLNIEIHFDKTKLDFKDLKNSILKGERFVKLSDGTNGIIPKKWIKKLSGVISFLEEKDGKILASKAQIKIVEEIIDIASEYNTDKIFEDMKKKFNSFQGIEEIKLPKELKGELRDYQKIGFYWLNFLREFGFGGVLADEMGLGKTLQVLSLLQNEKENNRLETCLIVVPVSLIFNWENEIRKFTPKLNFYIHHGLEREKDLASKILDKSKKFSENGEKIDLIITSYGTLRNDIEIFNKILF